ncbi:sigma factor-like helix-turn-helix DNA-binding protein [Demequina soli]|uniref:sigma factor-like helix-turn-helix DNA-binding protein n=1 Tax=Demequina soli TaxID=1638987 RepID=UPI0014715CB6|nr:sigma factor-like helix-turn-helix DNA-binding protein [Demequina soli]
MGARQRMLEATMRAHASDLLAYGRVLTGSSSGAVDLVEAALARVVGRGPLPETPDDAAVAVRAALRRAAVRMDRGPVETPATDDPDEAATLAALATLAPRERAVLVMRYRDGLAVDAIAIETSLRAGAVREALTRAVEQLSAARPGLGLRLDDVLEGGLFESTTIAIGGAR